MDYAGMTRKELERRCAQLEKSVLLYEEGDPRLLLLDGAIGRARRAGAPEAAIVRIILTWAQSGCHSVRPEAPEAPKTREAAHE